MIGAGFAELGYDMILVDIDENKVNLLNLAQSPIFVPGLEEIITMKKLSFERRSRSIALAM